MKKQISIALVVGCVVGLGVISWLGSKSSEPRYRGRSLDRWLDEYNRAGSLDQTKPAAEAIRSMGTNSLPFLLGHIEHTDSPFKRKVAALLEQQTLVNFPFFGLDRYQAPSILSLQALGSDAAPLLPELLSVPQDHATGWIGVARHAVAREWWRVRSW